MRTTTPRDIRSHHYRLLRLVRLFLVGLTGAFIVLGIAYEVLFIQILTRPAPSDICCTTPADWGFAYDAVTFTSEDGTQLSGWHIPAKNQATVILLHGYNNNRMGMTWHAEVLARHDYGVLLYDLRGHGESGGDRRSFGWADVDDVVAALNFLDAQATRDSERVGILGFSIGGQIALRATADTNRLHAVIADDPSFAAIRDTGSPTTLTDYAIYLNRWLMFQGIALRNGMAPPAPIIDIIGDIAPRPLLLISSEYGNADSTVRRYDANAREPKALWEIPAAWHGGEWTVAPEEYEARMIAFFDQALLANR